jgi:hypothetical protein
MRSSLGSNDEAESSRRTEALWHCLQSIKDFLAAYATIPLDSLCLMPLGATAHMSFAVVTASRILFLDDSDWDVNTARQNFDFAAACKLLSDRFGEADRLGQALGRRRKYVDDQKSVLGMYRDKLYWIRQWYRTKIPPVFNEAVAHKNPSSVSRNDEATVRGQARGRARAQDMEIDQQPSFLSPGGLDESFWQALLDFDGDGLGHDNN